MGTIGLGVSTVKNPVKAGKQAARAALDQLASADCNSCLVFATVGYNPETLLSAIRDETGDVPMVGCSGAGVIAPGIADESNHAVVVLALADSRLRLETAGVPDVTDSASAATAIGSRLMQCISSDSRFVLLFPCGLNVIADDFIDALETQIGKSLPILGGTSAENWTWRKTYQFHDWNVYDKGVSAAVVSGDFRLLTDVTHGCVPIGTELEVTKCDGNRLYQLSGKPVMDVMAEYLGEDVWSDFGKVAIHFCVGQALEGELADCYNPFVIRFIPKSFPEDKSICLPVKMQKGDRVWMTRRDLHKMFAHANNSILKFSQALNDSPPFLVLHFDCAGRGRVVMSEADKLELIRSFQQGIAPGVPWVGFYTYGEFCPIGGRNFFHNYTAALAVLC